MKPFDELTDDEIVALSNDEIQFYRDLACAEAGAPLSLPCPKAPEKPEIPDDQTVYMVGVFCFATADAAATVAEAINEHPRFEATYISGPSYRKFAKPDTDAVVVMPLRLLSADTARTMGEQIQSYEREKKQYQADQQAYDKATKSRESAMAEVNDRIEDAHRNVREREALSSEFARYLQLAEGNRVIAARFLEKARGGRVREVLPQVFDGVDMPTPVAVAVMEPDDDLQF